MNLVQLFEDRSKKAKAKVKEICQWLLNRELELEELMAFA